MKAIEIEKTGNITLGGSVQAKLGEGTIKLWNALPGEQVEALVIGRGRKKKAYVTKVIKASDKRIIPLEPGHFISCSPWQIFDWEYEQELKLKNAYSIYKELGIDRSEIKIESEGTEYGYRNKMEFSFYANDDDTLSLAFFKRGTKGGKLPIESCALAEDVLNTTAQKVVKWLNANQISRKQLKSLVVRSNGKQAIAALFVVDEDFDRALPELDEEFIGFIIYTSDPQSPASIPRDELVSLGQKYLIREVRQTKLKYGLLSFFQVNIPVFEKALSDISKYISKEDDVVDMFSGVGSISLPLAQNFNSAKLVEVNEEATRFARENIKINEIRNCEAILSSAEEVLDIIDQDKVVIVDPPRAGLHKKLIEGLKEARPKRVIYLSCNIQTQTDNIRSLIDNYKVTFSSIYNFFPRTPHIEGLVILERKTDID